MKILFGMPDKNSWGGVQNCEPPFVEALQNLGAQTAEETYVWGEKLGKITVRQRVERVLKTAFKFRKLLQENDYDILHLNTAFDTKALLRDVATVSLVKNRRTKIFLKMHGSDADLLTVKSGAKRIFKQRLFEKIDGIGVLSNEEKQNFSNAGVVEDKIFVVKNAVRQPQNLSSRSLDENDFRLLFVSRFVATKGLLEIIEAAGILRDKNFKFVLNCLGDGEIRNTAEKLTADLNLQNIVRFHGYLAETRVAEFYQNSDLLVFPTFHPEGFPMVIFDALAHGLPVITTKIRAAADYLKEPENCLWTEARNPENLAAKIAQLFKNKDLRRQMSKNNRRLAANFAAEKIAPQYLEIYQQLIRRA